MECMQWKIIVCEEKCLMQMAPMRLSFFFTCLLFIDRSIKETMNARWSFLGLLMHSRQPRRWSKTLSQMTSLLLTWVPNCWLSLCTVLVPKSSGLIDSKTTHFVTFSSAHNRKDGHRGELTNNARQDSVWSAEQLEAASAVAPSTPIDWALIRQNKQKYEELKWKGQSRLSDLGHTVDLFDYCLLMNWHRYCEPFHAVLLINVCVCHYWQTCHPWKRTFTLRLRAYPRWRLRTFANGGHFFFCGCYSVDFSYVVHWVDNSLWFVPTLKKQNKKTTTIKFYRFIVTCFSLSQEGEQQCVCWWP